MKDDNQKKDLNIIKTIEKNIGYRPTIIDKIKIKIQNKIKNVDKLKSTTSLKAIKEEKEDKKYIIFNCTGKETQRIVNKFRKYVSVAYKTNNTLRRILHQNIENKNNFETGVYKINCTQCNQMYIGQTFNFNKRFKNHAFAWKNKKPDRSNVANHLLVNKP